MKRLLLYASLLAGSAMTLWTTVVALGPPSCPACYLP